MEERFGLRVRRRHARQLAVLGRSRRPPVCHAHIRTEPRRPSVRRSGQGERGRRVWRSLAALHGPERFHGHCGTKGDLCQAGHGAGAADAGRRRILSGPPRGPDTACWGTRRRNRRARREHADGGARRHCDGDPVASADDSQPVPLQRDERRCGRIAGHRGWPSTIRMGSWSPRWRHASRRSTTAESRRIAPA